MKLSIRTANLVVLSVFISSLLFANSSSSKPHSRVSSTLFRSIKQLDANMNLSDLVRSGKTTVKICSCQILNLESNNYKQSDIAVFAERSSKGNFPTDVLIAKNTIEKEKKHMKLLFYDRLKVVDRISEATDCKSLYVKLKLKNNTLIIYDILNADIKR
jgi:hypothetical protein